ncbi:hypothetical protein BDB01DRAFT_900540 [Pilobolus umbonatus]|nr:hypothetical protein BDB01DRAFT_900540 [Pilobolus umbonatus]
MKAMNLKLLTPDKVSFDPIKPLILRGPPSETTSTVFTGNIVLSLNKPTKINSISVTFKSIATTYWPEGIGMRGTRLFHEVILSEERLTVVECKKNEYLKLPPGVHRFSFTFLIPNSVVETIDDVYGKVRHTVEAKVHGSGLPMLGIWHVSKPVLVLRAYMSDSLLVNNSFQDLSRTYEKHLDPVDVQVVVERAAFSSGDLFFLKLTLQPQQKKVRLEHMELTVTESRRYHVPELRANRTDSENFTLQYLTSSRLDNGLDVSHQEQQDELKSVFIKNGNGLDLIDTAAYRITFATPTCKANIHHTTHYKSILFRHHLDIKMIISYIDDGSTLMYNTTQTLTSDQQLYQALASSSIPTPFQHNPTPPSSTNTTPSITPAVTPSSSTRVSSATSPPSSRPTSTLISSNSHRFKWRKKEDQMRKEEMIRLETSVHVFDCRLKEDYGRLPSYSELNALSPYPEEKKAGPSDQLDEDFMLQRIHDSHYDDDSMLKPYLCACYFKFRRQMDVASQAQSMVAPDSFYALDKVPSMPPPDYAETI